MSSRWMEDTDSSTASDPALAGKVKQCYNDIEVDGSNCSAKFNAIFAAFLTCGGCRHIAEQLP